VCTYDIVPSLGPQSQVLHPAEASVFVQVSIPSTRSALDTHYKYRLLNYSSTKVPTGTVWHPPQVLVTHHRCSQDRAQHTIPGSQSEDQRKGSARPRCNIITNSRICGGNSQQARTITSYIPIPNLTHRSNNIQQFTSKYGKQGIQ